ncbi:hypothetical protein LZ31DRAFT_32375 [Colletotrichum somersetense]|nr:hypothetical protein LZ31DRAFT_32375 [Colletotrichum somersetense]
MCPLAKKFAQGSWNHLRLCWTDCVSAHCPRAISNPKSPKAACDRRRRTRFTRGAFGADLNGQRAESPSSTSSLGFSPGDTPPRLDSCYPFPSTPPRYIS